MDAPKANGLNKLNDDMLDSLAGGYIVHDPNNCCPYALVDDQYGNVKCRYGSVDLAQRDANGGSSGWGKKYNSQVISPEEYESLFGRKWD